MICIFKINNCIGLLNLLTHAYIYKLQFTVYDTPRYI